MTYDPMQPGTQPGQPPSPVPGQPGAPGAFPPPPYQPAGFPPNVVLAKPTRPSGRFSGGAVALILAAVVAAAGLGFAGGRVTAPAATTPTRNGFLGGNGGNGAFPSGAPSNFNGNGGLGGAFAGGAGVTVKGTVSSISNGQLVLTTTDGTSVTIDLPSTVTYHAQATASATDVTVGATVDVTVSGFRGLGRNGGAVASAAPSGSTTAAITATDVTIVSK